jgi:hypothetical protein
MAAPNSPTPIVTGTRSLKLPTFSGGQDKDDLSPLDFVERIETYVKSAKRDENDSCVEMHLALRSNALLWWRTLSRRGIDVNVWKEVRKEFLNTYSPKITGQTAHAIGQLEQKATETVNDYFNRLDQIFDEMLMSFPPVPTSQLTTYNDLRNHVQKQLFTGGLKESLRVEVLKAQSATLMDSLKEASKVELILKKPANRLFAIDETDDDEHETDLDEDEIMAINQRRKKMGKRPIRGRRNNFSNNGNSNNGSNNDIKCYNCNKSGHISKNCTAPRRKPIRSLQDEQRDEENEGRQPASINSIQERNNLDFW